MSKCQCCEESLPCELQTGTAGNCCDCQQPEKQIEPEESGHQQEKQIQAQVKPID